MITEDPGVYYIRDHCLKYSWALVRLSGVEPDALCHRIQSAHRIASTAVQSLYPNRSRVSAVWNGPVGDPAFVSSCEMRVTAFRRSPAATLDSQNGTAIKFGRS